MTDKQIKMMKSMELFKQYFKTESSETILKNWDELNDEYFEGITIGEFQKIIESKLSD